MARKVLIQIRRGPEAEIGALNVGELGFCTDSQKLYIGTSSGNVLLVAAQTVGDMLKSIYDTDSDGIVDAAETVPWSGVSGKPSSFTPSSHTHDDRYYTENEINVLTAAKQDTLGFTPANTAGDTFMGKVVLPAATTDAASLNVPHGSAPTSPVNGDIWTTTSSVYARINGTNRTIIHNGIPTSLASDVSQAEAEAGTSTTRRWFTAERVKQAIAANAMPLGPVTWGQLKGV